MMRLPAGATGFFETGTFREPIQRGGFLQAGLSAGPGEPVHRGRNYGKNFYATKIISE